jgi:transcriptional regulator of acetoin/glycerol metabolism
MEILRAGREAHTRYLSTGRISADLLRAPILRAWERCHDRGADPRMMRAEVLGPLQAARLFEERRALIAAARPYMTALSQAAGQERHAAMLGDADALVLDVLGDEASVHGPESVPEPGALLSEATAGANGIGSPLAEDGYIEIVGPEHFIGGFHPFSCQGVPLRDASHRVAGVLSVSVRRPEAGERLREILVCAAHGIEAELARERLEEDVRRLVASAEMDAAFIERLRQDIVQSQTATRIKVEAAAISLAKSRIERAAQMIRLAEASIDGFRRQTDLWHSLAAADTGAPGAVALDQMVADLLLLLQTEASIARIAIDAPLREPVLVRADPRRLARVLFRAILRAFDAARDGGSVRVEVRRRNGGEVTVVPTPPAGSARPPAEPARVLLPLANEAPRDDEEVTDVWSR